MSTADNNVRIKWDHFGVFRRFIFQMNANTDLYEELMLRIIAVVPNFRGRLGWQDEEGDVIYFSTNSEMRDAIQLSDSGLLRVKTIDDASEMNKEKTSTGTNKRTKVQHPGVNCDRCDQPVFGIRYKCAVCDDFDLCEECEKDGAHPDHAMIRYATPRTPHLDIPRARRYWRHSFHERDPFLQGGIFKHRATAAATAAAQNAARHAASAAQHAAQHAAAAAAQHAAAAAAQFAENTDGDGDNGGERQHFRTSVAQGMEYLKEVGAQIQQALANFGIEVDMDVQHGNLTEKVPKTNASETKNGADTNNENGENKVNVQNDDSAETKNQDGKRKSDDSAAGENVEDGMNPEHLSAPLKKMHISDDKVLDETGKSPKELKEEATNSDDISEDWTMMDISGSGNNKVSSGTLYPVIDKTECMAGTPFIVPLPGPHNPHCHFIYPDQQIAICVEQLEAMGFDNCNGWLTRLAAELKGDVDSVIEAMKGDPIYVKHFESNL